MSEAFADVVPDCKLWISDDEMRQLRSPTVFHRAFEFAAARTAHPLIWIDQECIDQTDAEDIEYHLQVMEAIYRRATSTVAVLSKVINTPAALADLEVLLFAVGVDPSNFDPMLSIAQNPEQIRSMVAILQFLAEDPWFSRTWTFHERLCASQMYFLLPVSANLPVGATLQQSFQFLQDQGIRAMSGEGSILGLLPFNRYVHCSAHMEKTWPWSVEINATWFACLGTAFTYAMGQPSFSLSDPFRQWFEEISALIRAKLQQDGGIAWRRDRTTLGANDILRIMETCQNSVVADRLVVMANINRWVYTLRTRELDKPHSSFSTAMLVLRIWNSAHGWKIEGRRRVLVRKGDMESGEVSREVIRRWYSKIADAVFDRRVLDVRSSALDIPDHQLGLAIMSTLWQIPKQ